VSVNHGFQNSLKITFSCSQYAENLLTRNLVHAENYLTRSLYHFTIRQNRFFSLRKCQKFPHALRGILKPWFLELADIEFSGSQNSENENEAWYMRKVSTHEGWYP